MISLRVGPLAFVLCLTLLCGCASSGKSGYAASGTGPQTDEGIRQSVLTYWAHDYPKAPPLAVTVEDGVVSLTGTVDDAQMRVDAVRDAWQPAAVTEVVNELKVTQSIGPATRKDDATTIKLRTRLTFDPAIQSTDYSIETVGGTIYLMGVARDNDELSQVRKMAESVAGPGKVVSYVRPRVSSLG